MIKAEDLIEKFRYALDNKWGYIWGTAGILWTEAKQKQKVNYMVSKYGTNWQKNADAKDDNYYSAAVYGSKWIGHYVADCSGLFAWAFKQLGGAIAHGSNSIWDRYCTSKGKLSNGRRTDKKDLLPGTAVFTGTDQKKPHIGLYVGSNKVIEASGTVAGVVTSNINASKWKYWGELKNVKYTEQPQPDPGLPTLRKGDKGEYVTLMQTKLANKGYDLGKYGVDGDFGKATEAAVKAFQKDHGLSIDGVCGEKTWEALNQTEPTVLYTVTIPHLTLYQADALIEKYPGSIKETERG